MGHVHTLSLGVRGRQFFKKLEFQGIHLGTAVLFHFKAKNNLDLKISLIYKIVGPVKFYLVILLL